MSEFLLENYMWIIVGIVLLMTIIGYIADKTDFGHRQVLKRQKKEEEKEKVINDNLKQAENEAKIEQLEAESEKQITDEGNAQNVNDFWGNDETQNLVAKDDSAVESEDDKMEPLEAIKLEELPTIDNEDDMSDDIPSELKVPLGEINIDNNNYDLDEIPSELTEPLEESTESDINQENISAEQESKDKPEDSKEDNKDDLSDEIPSELTVPLEESTESDINQENISAEQQSEDRSENENGLSNIEEQQSDFKIEDSKLPDIPEAYFDLSEIGDDNLYSSTNDEKEENVLPELDNESDTHDSENIWKF